MTTLLKIHNRNLWLNVRSENMEIGDNSDMLTHKCPSEVKNTLGEEYITEFVKVKLCTDY